jgi:hypothetical protein
VTDERSSQKLAVALAASTEKHRKHNDTIETPIAKAARERKERLYDCRRCLRTMRDEGLPHKIRINGALSILSFILDELEAR